MHNNSEPSQRLHFIPHYQSTLVKSCQHYHALKASTQYRTSAITVMRGTEKITNCKTAILFQIRQNPRNTNMEKPLHFFSIKKRKLPSTHLSKPSHNESGKCNHVCPALMPPYLASDFKMTAVIMMWYSDYSAKPARCGSL